MDTLTPLAKTRAALERKAAQGDVQAARELRENADHYYGSAATGDAWTKALDEHQLAVVRACIEDALAGRESTWISAEDVPQRPLH